MENIIEFPTKSVRDWLIIERSLKAGLKQLGASATVEARLVEKMKAFWDFLDPAFDYTFEFEFEMTGNMSEEQKAAFRSRLAEKISALNKEKIDAFTKKLFIERLDCEINFCRELGLF